MLFYTAYLERDHKRWTWFCDGVALCCAAAFSFLKITQGATIAAVPMRLLWVLIYLFSFAATALYLQKRTWWVGSTWRIIVAGLTVGISTLVLMQTLLPIIQPAWPWTARAQSVTPSLAFDIGLIFAFGIVGVRYKHNSRPIVPYILLCLFPLLLADTFFFTLSWAPWGQDLQAVPMPLYALHSTLLALAAYRDATYKPRKPRSQPSTMPLTEWLLWALFPFVMVLFAFAAATMVGSAPRALVGVLIVAAVVHEVMAVFDYRRVTLALYQARIEAEDLARAAERNRVAGELHDDLGRYLTIANLQLSGAHTLFTHHPEQARVSVARAQHLTAEALTAVQRSVAALRNSSIDDRPLPEVIQELVYETQLAGLQAELIVIGEPHPLPLETKAVLFRAAQEALTNILKHADATHANLILDYSDAAQIRLVIEDNGQGGSPTSGGMGLAIMRERVARIGGTVHTHTVSEEGFTVAIEVPR
ncbi:MAG TPA: sensor histidine kinase [Herpetosiphonaceae bacterium]